MAKTPTPTYEPEIEYRFRLLKTVKTPVRLSRADVHRAKGALLNRIVEMEGPDVIDTAEPV
jgi:hypothetical protein